MQKEEAAELTEHTGDTGWTKDASVMSKHYGCRMIETINGYSRNKACFK